MSTFIVKDEEADHVPIGKEVFYVMREWDDEDEVHPDDTCFDKDGNSICSRSFPTLMTTLSGTSEEANMGDVHYFFVNNMWLHIPHLSVGLRTNFDDIYSQHLDIVFQFGIYVFIKL